jgi:CHAT domain-containing protein
MGKQDQQAYLKLVQALIQTIDESSGNPQVIYPLFRDNLLLFNEQLIINLKVWANDKFNEVKQEDRKNIAKNIGRFGNLIQQFHLGNRATNLEIAITTYELALIVVYRDEDPAMWGAIQNSLAIAYSYRIRGDRAENLELAINFYRSALEVYTCEAFPERWAITQNNLAAAYQERIRSDRAKNLELAIESYLLALEIRTHEAFPEQWAMTQNNLANAYNDRLRGEKAGNLELAIESYLLALNVYTREAFPEDWAMIQNNLANAYRKRIRGERKENLEKSLESYQLALDVYTYDAFPEFWAMTQNNLAIFYADDNKHELAIDCYRQALEIFTPETLPINALEANRGLGDIYFKLGNSQLAIDTYDFAIQAAETSRSWAIDEDSRQRIIREALSVYENTIQAHINLGQIDKAIVTSERARSRQLVDFMRTNDLYTDAEIPAEVQTYLSEYEALQQQIQSQQFAPTNDNLNVDLQLTTSTRDSRALTQVSNTVKALEVQKQTVWRKIWALDPEIAAQQQVTPIDLATIQSLIKTPDTAILSFYTTQNDTHIFILTHNQPPQIHTCKGQGLQQIQAWLEESWLAPYVNSKSDWLAQISATLSEVAQRLELVTLISKLDEIDNLIIVPHFYLHQIPFAALPILGGLLGDKFTIRYAPSCQILKYCEDRPIITHTQYGTIENADGTLPGAGFEGANIATLFNITDNYRLQGRQQATIDGFHALMKQSQQPVTTLHFANHAQSRLDNPLKSALQLADGNITLDRLMISRYLNLHEVFLSCCETHLGATQITDDILTLATGFLCAGARTLISTFWAVDDLATALFSIFYYHNRYDGYNRAKSLKMAQVRLRNLTGEEFKLNYRDNLETHLTAYAKANKSERKGLKTRLDRGEIDKDTHDQEYTRLTTAYKFALGLVESLDRYSQTDKPFADPYYWAAFTCQGLA